MLILAGLILTGCKDMASVNKNELLETDLTFSELSEAKGMNHAFMEYLADGGVLLKPNKMPIVGKDAINKLFEGDDSNFTLTWTPNYADIAESGELGYTYGTYKFTTNKSTEVALMYLFGKRMKTVNGNMF